ncbi:LacI family DNA-binding transcriptional regulator [Nostocoides sp. F2B08]|uniref:LacI family DNA-binding transcriptional regulator n=1 Tax=Nostocoides sp. F2B08 TaxID=2653936 RepID=UPI0012631719|nr:LacI family DNA-binding transcriptional regulator [Tetrasphaera sp. F2B08]KAB7745485.1 LacI family DNA-binding transcriptional regulator [Tetrasphaera sp. F2B08]
MPRARLVDVAAEAGVSTATASLVLRGRPGPSQASRDAVQDAARRLAYRPDRSASLLASRRSRHLGVLIAISSTFHAELVEVLDGAAADAGLDLVLGTTTPRRSEQQALEALLDQRCEGIVLVGPGLSEARIDAVAREVPTVVVGRLGTSHSTGVLADDATGMDAIVDHLVDLGHRSIAYVDGPRGSIATARRRGFRDAMRRRDLDVVVIPGGVDETAGLAAAEEILSMDNAARPTAVACFNDHCAVGVRTGLARTGITVPEQMSVTGYDDSPLARLATIELTTVSQDPPALAAAVVAVLSEALTSDRRDTDEAQSPPHTDVIVSPRLVVRASTAPPTH